MPLQNLETLLKACIVRVSSERGPQSGSGFFVAPGLLLTCANLVAERRGDHLIALNGSVIRVDHAPGNSEYGEVVQWWGEADIALIRVPVTQHACVFLHPEYQLRDALRCIGYSPGREREVHTTSIRSELRTAWPSISVEAFPRAARYSGAALLNERTGGICGVMVGVRAIDHARRNLINALYHFILDHCNEDDVKQICFQLNKAYEQLPDLTFTGKVAALAVELERQHQVEQVVELLYARGVKDPWPRLTPSTEAGTASHVPATAVDTAFQREYSDDQTRAIPIASLFDAGLLAEIQAAQQRYHAVDTRWIDTLISDQFVAPGPFFPPEVPRPPRCPYPGLRPFSIDESAYFYGREQVIHEIEQLVSEPRLRLIVISGPSGSGKSSLVNAGLYRHLSAGFPQLLVLIVRPGSNPTHNLQSALEMGELAADQALQAVDALLERRGCERLLLILDQFEEVFTNQHESRRHIDSDQQSEFARILSALRRHTAVQVTLMLVIRDDFVADLAALNLAPQTQSEHYLLGPLDAKGLRAIIERPARHENIPIEQQLVARLIREAEVLRDQGALPLLQLALERLWYANQHRNLTESLYDQRIGGLARVVQTYADGVISELEAHQGDITIARRIFLRLINFGEGHDDTRRQLPIARLQAPDDDEHFDHTLNHLINGRLLTTSDTSASARIDIVHEALIRHWQTLRTWLAAEPYQGGEQSLREAEQTRRTLEQRVMSWRTAGETLSRHSQIEAAQQWRERYSSALGSVEGLDLLIAESRNKLKMLIVATVIAVCLGLTIFCGGLYIFWLRTSALL